MASPSVFCFVFIAWLSLCTMQGRQLSRQLLPCLCFHLYTRSRTRVVLSISRGFIGIWTVESNKQEAKLVRASSCVCLPLKEQSIILKSKGKAKLFLFLSEEQFSFLRGKNTLFTLIGNFWRGRNAWVTVGQGLRLATQISWLALRIGGALEFFLTSVAPWCGYPEFSEGLWGYPVP